MTALAIDLVRALFCGLIDREFRMAVFISASDESSDENKPRRHFFYAGFAAPLDDWDGPFARAWNERVLVGPPKITCLHVTDCYSHIQRQKIGLSLRQANERLDEAARVIRSMGSLVPVCWSLDRNEYDRIVRQPFNPRPGQVDTMDPDYICFLYFAITQLDWLYRAYGDEVEKVDFWVEKNGKITRHLRHFYDQLADGVNWIDLPHLAPLIGQLLPVDKERIPAQAADMLAWHARNAAGGSLDRDGERRYWRMTEGGFHDGRKGRYGYRGTLQERHLLTLAEGLAKRVREGAYDESVKDDDSL